MKTVYKYPLQVRDTQAVRMPFGARILSVQVQGDAPVLWALVENDNTPTDREVRMVLTGGDAENAVGSGFEYVGTLLLHGGLHVEHVFAEPA